VAFVDYYSSDRILGVDEDGDPIDTNDAADVFVTVPGSGVYERVSVASDGNQGGAIEADIRDPDPFASAQPRLSNDGRYVAFISRLQGLDPRVNSLERHAYVHDRQTKTTEVVSINSRGDPVSANEVALSDDGRTVAFVSYERDFGARDRNPGDDVFVRDLDTDKTVLASFDSTGRQFHNWRDRNSSTNHALAPYLSGDGRYLTFIGPRDTDPTVPAPLVDETVWVRDLDRNRTIKGSLGSHGHLKGQSLNPSLTPDGLLLSYESSVRFLQEDTNGLTDVFVRKLRPSADLSGTVVDGKLFPDGHAEPVAGAMVELRDEGRTVYGPTATDGEGGYSFRNIVPGSYRLRVTFEDARYMPSSGMPPSHLEPIFDVRYTENATGPLWVEVDVEVEDADRRKDVAVSRSETLVAVSADVPRAEWGHLDDMAAIFTSTQKYIGWLIKEISPVMESDRVPLPVPIHVYSRARNLAAGPFNAFHLYEENAPIKSVIHIGTGLSDYERRDGVGGGDWGPFTEWHEFTHHLSWVNGIGTHPDDRCVAVNHKGYNNPSTCDSVLEGVAAFLPTVAYPELMPSSGSPAGVYPLFNENLESNGLKAFSGNARDGEFSSWEEDAVAALLWDLYDPNADQHALSLVGADGVATSAAVTDSMNLPLRTIWDLLATRKTVRFLWQNTYIDRKLDEPIRLSLDLDGDGTLDTSPFDVPFLLHGFYPLGDGDFATARRHYALQDASRFTGNSPNRAIGRTDSPNPRTSDYRQRQVTPTEDRSTIAVEVLERSGTPVEDGFVVLRVSYPEGFTDEIRIALTGEGAEEIALRLPPHSDVPLDSATAGSLSCEDTEVDYPVEVSMFAVADGVESEKRVSFSNCEYGVATVMADTGEPALTESFKLPRRRAKLAVRARTTRAGVLVRGKLTPGQPGSPVVITLQRKRDGWQTVDRHGARLGPSIDRNGDRIGESVFRAKLGRVEGGRCRVLVTWAGDTSHFGTKEAVGFSC
ncbi:MAG TPA: carboxypeptidase regulatory-like domain-containing protein, partial [Actinomycetota bacterium]|nr:carboxypeptidase regulatory-like domain-containing protein [Actinomycetota bacterium]